jgi:hypothetical protein
MRRFNTRNVPLTRDTRIFTDRTPFRQEKGGIV